MSIKTTSHVYRTDAERIIREELSNLDNVDLGDILDIIAESTSSSFGTEFDNFLVDDDEPIES